MGHKKPEVAAKRREVVGMFFKWILRFYYKHSPTCSKCGWAMKPFTKSYFEYQWICIWTFLRKGGQKCDIGLII